MSQTALSASYMRRRRTYLIIPQLVILVLANRIPQSLSAEYELLVTVVDLLFSQNLHYVKSTFRSPYGAHSLVWSILSRNISSQAHLPSLL